MEQLLEVFVAQLSIEGDNIEEIVVDSVLKASEVEGFTINDKDIVSITESIVARAQGNYATIDHIAKDVQSKFGEETIGVIFPILSRNRFAICLRGIAKGAKKIVLMLSYPSDEVGNHLVDLDMLDEKGINPWTDVLTEENSAIISDIINIRLLVLTILITINH